MLSYAVAGSDIVGDDLALVSRTAPHHTPSDYPDQRQRFVQEKDSSGLASGSDSLTGADSDSDSSNDNDESDDEGDGENERGDISDDVSDSQHAINDAGKYPGFQCLMLVMQSTLYFGDFYGYHQFILWRKESVRP